MKSDGLPTLKQIAVLYRDNKLNGEKKLVDEFLVAIHNEGLTFEKAYELVSTSFAEADADALDKAQARVKKIQARQAQRTA